MNGGGVEEGKGSGMCMNSWDIQWTDDWSVSSFSKWDKMGGRDSSSLFIGVSDMRVQRRVRWGKVGPTGLPYILSRS